MAGLNRIFLDLEVNFVSIDIGGAYHADKRSLFGHQEQRKLIQSRRGQLNEIKDLKKGYRRCHSE